VARPGLPAFVVADLQLALGRRNEVQVRLAVADPVHRQEDPRQH
jgi:hypothetical protein